MFLVQLATVKPPLKPEQNGPGHYSWYGVWPLETGSFTVPSFLSFLSARRKFCETCPTPLVQSLISVGKREDLRDMPKLRTYTVNQLPCLESFQRPASKTPPTSGPRHLGKAASQTYGVGLIYAKAPKPHIRKTGTRDIPSKKAYGCVLLGPILEPDCKPSTPTTPRDRSWAFYN